MGRRGASGLIAGLAVQATGAGLPVLPIPHWPAGARPWAGIPNAVDVLSNAGFVPVGALGLGFVLSPGATPGRASRDSRERWPYVVFFGGLLLTGFGSTGSRAIPGRHGSRSPSP